MQAPQPVGLLSHTSVLVPSSNGGRSLSWVLKLSLSHSHIDSWLTMHSLTLSCQPLYTCAPPKEQCHTRSKRCGNITKDRDSWTHVVQPVWRDRGATQEKLDDVELPTERVNITEIGCYVKKSKKPVEIETQPIRIEMQQRRVGTKWNLKPRTAGSSRAMLRHLKSKFIV
jgi:hypothetical protein